MITYIRIGHPAYPSRDHDVALGRLNYFYHPGLCDNSFIRWLSFIRTFINKDYCKIYNEFNEGEFLIRVVFKYKDFYNIDYTVLLNLYRSGEFYISEERVGVVYNKNKNGGRYKNILHRTDGVKFYRQGQRKAEKFKISHHESVLSIPYLDDPYLAFIRDYIYNAILFYHSNEKIESCRLHRSIKALKDDGGQPDQHHGVARAMLGQSLGAQLAELIQLHQAEGFTAPSSIVPSQALVILSDIDCLCPFPNLVFEYITNFLNNHQFIVSFRSENLLKSVISLGQWDGFYYDYQNETFETNIYYIKHSSLLINQADLR